MVRMISHWISHFGIWVREGSLFIMCLTLLMVVLEIRSTSHTCMHRCIEVTGGVIPKVIDFMLHTVTLKTVLPEIYQYLQLDFQWECPLLHCITGLGLFRC